MSRASKRVAVLGNGGFGTAMALVALENGHDVSLWGHDSVYTAAIAATRKNPRYLAAVELPDALHVGADPGAVLDAADIVLVGVPTQHVRDVLAKLLPHLPAGVPLVSLSKGLEQASGRRPSEVVREVVGSTFPIYVLSGPSHAEEIALGLPCTVVLAGPAPDGPGDDRSALDLQRALSGGSFRIYRNADLLGVELCGALKNVIALAAGIAEGLGLGDNTKAAVLSRGLAEMQRFGVAAGARAETFHGLAGTGDLAVTAFSKHGRNRAFGERIGRGETLDEILASTQKVAEGVWTSRVVQERARGYGIEMPICDAVCAVLFDGMPAAAAVRELMERQIKPEGGDR